MEGQRRIAGCSLIYRAICPVAGSGSYPYPDVGVVDYPCRGSAGAEGSLSPGNGIEWDWELMKGGKDLGVFVL